MPRAATRTLRASRRTGSTAPASTAWSNASRALCWAPASMPQHRARAHAAHPGAAPARLQSGTLTTAQPPTSARSCTAQRSSSGASPCCRSFVQCSVRAAQRQADPWHARAAVGRRPAERVRAASAAMSPAAASERCKEAASRMLFRRRPPLRLVYHFFSRRTVDRRRRTVDRLGRLNMQPPVLHSGATLADERRQMPSRPAGERPSGENARHNGRVAVWRKLALESRERAALCSERFRPMSV